MLASKQTVNMMDYAQAHTMVTFFEATTTY
jgi:hypothetical protein